MKNTLLVLFCLISTIGFAQNYQCLQYGPKYYFLNGEGYLRGIRIDSTFHESGYSVYYPYRSLRSGHYIASPYYGHIDTNGGSWLGKRVIQLDDADGTFLFDNIWGDTTIIKTHANLGDSWTFFNDTTNVSYIATVTAIDTETVVGAFDSVKTITITADSAGMPRIHDPVNNFQMKLSKGHGFTQIFDLYTFPYHRPDTFDIVQFFDYYLDNLLGNIYYCDVDYCYQHLPNVANSVFKKVNFHNPTTREIYDFAVGDIYEFYWDDARVIDNVYIEERTIDTIVSKVVGVYTVDYTTKHHFQQDIYDPYGGVSHFYSAGVGGFHGDTTLLLNMDKMPEEIDGLIYHYYPNCYIYDTLGCYSTIGYTIDRGHVLWTADGDGYEGIPTSSISYAIGYGNTSEMRNFILGDETIDQEYMFIYKNGDSCYGRVVALDEVKSLSIADHNLKIFPNPANDQFTVKTENYNQSHTITITNTMGQIVGQVNTDKNEELISTTDYAPGLYYVTVTDKSGGRLIQKLAVVH